MIAEPTYQRVCATADIAPGTVAAVTVGAIPIALVCTRDGEYFAVHDECSHLRVALSGGEVHDRTLECSLHGSRFDLRTGQPTGEPATRAVPVFPVAVRDGVVYVSPSPSNGVDP